MKYTEAIKRSANGYANAKGDNYRAIVCESLAEHTSLSRVALYNWSKKHMVDPSDLFNGYSNGRYSFLDLIAAVLNDTDPSFLTA
jgi:hypothetical protein